MIVASVISFVCIFCTLYPVLLAITLDLHSLGCNDHNRGFDGTTCRSLTPNLFYFLQVISETIDASVRDEE